MSIRWDRATIRKRPVRTPEGFLKVEASATRTGVFQYLNGDGSVRRELRHPAEVLAANSLDSMKLIPVTNGHPETKLVTSETARQFQVGATGENIRPDGEFVVVPIVITDQTAIQDVEAGRRFVSMGYETDLVPERGKYDGEEYDARQTKIRYNHLALVDAARAGPDATVHLDSDDAVQVYDDDTGARNDTVVPFKSWPLAPESATWDAAAEIRKADVDDLRVMATWFDSETADTKAAYKLPHHRAADKYTVWAGVSAAMGALLGARGGVDIPQSDRRRVYSHLARHYREFDKEPPDLRGDEDDTHSQKGAEMPKQRIDGIDYEAAQEVINHLGKETARADAAEKELATVKAELEKVTGERDAKADELKKATDGHDKAIADAVKSRRDLERKAEPVLKGDEKVKVDEMDDRAVKVAVIQKVHKDADLEGKSDEYIDARFDAALEAHKGQKADEKDGDDAFASQRVQAKADASSGDENDPEKARNRMVERLVNDSKPQDADK